MELRISQIEGLEGSEVSDGSLSLDRINNTFGIQRGGLVNLSDIDESSSLQNPAYILANRGSGDLHEITYEDVKSGSEVYGVYSPSMVPETDHISLVWSGSSSNPDFSVTEPGVYHLLAGNVYMYISVPDINIPARKLTRNWTYIFSKDEIIYAHGVTYEPSQGFSAYVASRTYVGLSDTYRATESYGITITEIWKGI